MTENVPTTATRTKNKSAKQKTRKVKKGKFVYSDNPELCSHSLFNYLTDKQATQVCMTCGARRRIRHNPENRTATVGTWKAQEKNSDHSEVQ